MNLPQKVYDGSDLELSRIFLRSASGTAQAPAVRFFSRRGAQVNGGAAGQAVSLTLTTSWQSLASLWEAAAQALDSGASWSRDVDGREAAAVVSDSLTGEAWVSLGDPSPPVPSLKVSSGSRLRLGPAPVEAEGSGPALQGQVAAVLVDLQREEDSPHSSGHRGLMALAVRQDAPGAVVSADGDYAPLMVSSLGRLKAGMALETHRITAALATAGEALLFPAFLGLGSIRYGADSGSLAVTPQGSNDGVTWINLLHWQGSWSAPTPTTGSQTVSVTHERIARCAGFAQVRLLLNSGSGTLWAVGMGYDPVPPQTIQSGRALCSLDQVTAAHDSAAPSSILQMGAEARALDGALVQSGDSVRVLASLLGKQVMLPHALPSQTWQFASPDGGITAAGQTVVQASGGPGVRHCVRSLQLANQSPNAVVVSLRDGPSGSVLWRAKVDADSGAAGFSASFEPPLRGSANSSLILEASAAGEVWANAQGFTSSE